MRELFDQFLREKRFLTNASPRTLKYYDWVFARWLDYVGQMPTPQNIKEFVIRIQESGVTVYTANSYIRGMNSFLSWLAETNETERLKIKKLKEPEKILKLFSDAHLKAFITYRPKTFARHRLYAMVVFALDTGCRVSEMLNLRRTGIDLDNLLVTLHGKGDKERIVPISIECRKELYRFMRKHRSDYVFPTGHGERLAYYTALEQFHGWCKELGVSGVRPSWHTLRHTFAANYVRAGGNILYLQRVLGHTDLQTTRIYVKAQPEDLLLMHKKVSLVSRLR